MKTKKLKFFFCLLILILLLVLTLFSCNTMYQFSRTLNTQNSPIKDDFNFPEKKELGQYLNLIDSNIRINLLLKTGEKFIIKSDSPIYKDNKAVETVNPTQPDNQSQNSTSSQGSDSNKTYYYEITAKDIGSTFISFSFISLEDMQVSKVLKVEKKDDTGFYLIANIPLIFYLAGVLSAEMGKSFPDEALKAQAVAARTYLYSSGFSPDLNPSNNQAGSNTSLTLNSKNKKPYDVENSTNFQVFSFKNIEYFIPYVAATDNLVLKYDGSVFPTYFHSHSGGILTTPELVWGKKISNVYKVKEDIFSGDSYKWKAEIGRFFLKTLFQRAGFDVDGYCENIEILKIGEDKRVSKIKLSFSNGKIVELTGDAFRKVVGTTVIKSTNFSFTYDASNQNFIFNGIGYGHGIGLSQYGAKTMAERGFSFDRILAFYYDGSKLEKR
ncbi:MAG TPA: SpoIID/LytB domain-containing protein [Exilispira sp.]|nr:SpoIID/LytB domain-containing protein [Exilispira sp.]